MFKDERSSLYLTDAFPHSFGKSCQEISLFAIDYYKYSISLVCPRIRTQATRAM